MRKRQKSYQQWAPSKKYVQNMFDSIADNYDGFNHSMSLGIDKSWRRYAIDYLREQGRFDSILDVATGTGDLSISACKILKPSEIIGIDISDNMLKIAENKIAKGKMEDIISFVNADCSNLPFDDNRFDAVISAFALRNFEDLGKCLSEMYRVLKPGGFISIIDLCNPVKPPMRELFWCYKKMVMPIVGRIKTHSNSSYKYLPYSMSIIPQGKEMCRIFNDSGFSDVKYRRLRFQMCIHYNGIKR